MYFKDFSSGAMIENIVRRAKKLAIKRLLGGGTKGIQVADLVESIHQEYKEHEDLPNTTNPDDWAKISGKKGERIVYVRTIVQRDDDETPAGRSLHRARGDRPVPLVRSRRRSLHPVRRSQPSVRLAGSSCTGMIPVDIPEPERAELVDLDRTTLRTWGWGTRPTPLVLCLHGAYDHGRMFDGIAPRLAALGYHVVAVDFRGHGDSGPLDTGFAWTLFHLDLALLIRHLGGGPVGFVAHSFGGGQATGVAARSRSWSAGS